MFHLTAADVERSLRRYREVSYSALIRRATLLITVSIVVARVGIIRLKHKWVTGEADRNTSRKPVNMIEDEIFKILH